MNTETATYPTRDATCPTHGSYISTNYLREYWSTCPTCTDERRRAEEDEFQRLELAERLADSGIPPKFSAAVLDASAPAKVRSWRMKGPLVLIGPVGTGKTYLAAAMLKRYLAEYRNGLYVTCANYGRMIRDTWSGHADYTETHLLQRYSRSSMLVLDELGGTRDIDVPLIQDLVQARYDAGLLGRTIIVSNFPVTKFSDLVGERVADRIREDGVICSIGGASRRKPAA